MSALEDIAIGTLKVFRSMTEAERREFLSMTAADWIAVMYPEPSPRLTGRRGPVVFTRSTPREDINMKFDIEDIGKALREATGDSLYLSCSEEGWRAGMNGTAWVHGQVSAEVAVAQVVEKALGNLRKQLNGHINALTKAQRGIVALEAITPA